MRENSGQKPETPTSHQGTQEKQPLSQLRIEIPVSPGKELLQGPRPVLQDLTPRERSFAGLPLSLERVNEAQPGFNYLESPSVRFLRLANADAWTTGARQAIQ